MEVFQLWYIFTISSAMVVVAVHAQRSGSIRYTTLIMSTYDWNYAKSRTMGEACL